MIPEHFMALTHMYWNDDSARITVTSDHDQIWRNQKYNWDRTLFNSTIVSNVGNIIFSANSNNNKVYRYIDHKCQQEYAW